METTLLTHIMNYAQEIVAANEAARREFEPDPYLKRIGTLADRIVTLAKVLVDADETLTSAPEPTTLQLTFDYEGGRIQEGYFGKGVPALVDANR